MVTMMAEGDADAEAYGAAQSRGPELLRAVGLPRTTIAYRRRPPSPVRLGSAALMDDEDARQ
jgi:hypothetical protein